MARAHLRGISFSYPVYELTGRSLKVSLFRQVKSLRQVTGATSISSGAGFVQVDALRDVTLTLDPGDRLGLIGRNGSGKSTLLRVFAGLAHPQQGQVEIVGRVVPLIEKGLGINPELSGLANIELPLRLLGANNREVAHAKQSIPDWTGLGPFIHMPVRTYSEGMKARLAFAVCTAIDADVLVLDEWLGAGDLDFMQRAQERMHDMIQRAKILVLATHSLDLLMNVCNKVAWLNQGSLVMVGPPQTVVPLYIDSVQNALAQAAE